MKFTIPTNWQPDLLSNIIKNDKNKKIKEIYGKLAFDEIGGGRASFTLPFVSKKQAEIQISKIKDYGFRFNYLLNSICLNNLEFTRIGQKKIKKLLNWLCKINVKHVTVANPYIAMWIKENYPHINIAASAMANIDSVNKAIFWENIGISTITLPGSVNRNLALLKKLRQTLKCNLQLIANNSCLLDCPLAINHALLSCHASTKWHQSRGYVFDYNVFFCRLNRFQNPANFIRSDWIRPEDIIYYKNLGIDSIKLVDRRMPTNIIINIVNAYLNYSYDGNLLDLFPSLQGKSFNNHKNWVIKLCLLKNIFSFHPIKIIHFSKILKTIDAYIDNKKLHGFIENLPKNCNPLFCNNCKYCEHHAKQAITIDTDYLKTVLNEYETIIDSISKKGLSFF